MFPKYIFWDKENVDLEKDVEYVVLRVLQYWDIEDWIKLEKMYWKEKILKIVERKGYSLDKKTLNLISVIWWKKFNFKQTDNVLKPTFSNRFQKKVVVGEN